MYKVIVTSYETGEVLKTIVSDFYPTKICWEIELNDYDKKCEIVKL